MKVEKIQSIVTPKTTGYSAAAAIGMAVLSGVSKNNAFRKAHKPFAWASAVLTALHVGLIEYYNYKYKNKGTKMSIESELFLKYTPDMQKLLNYGFCEKKKEYSIEKTFLNNEFRANIVVYKDGKVSGTVYDTENNEEYIPLRIEHQEGAFVGEVRNEYIKILTDIRENCFTENYFVTSQGNRISALIKEKYNDKPVFMWEDYPTFGVFKNLNSGKWYGLIMYIERAKLNKMTKGFVEVINLKLDKDKIPELIKKDGIYPAYHMNKKYWVSVCLDETLSDKEVMTFIEESHSYTENKVRK